MPSPFPGMDPYLEQFWGDVHHTLITYACGAIQRQLPSDLVARMDERVFVEPSEGKPGTSFPMFVSSSAGCQGTATVDWQRNRRRRAVDRPSRESEPTRQGFIEIIDIKSGRRVVTVIEVLSPSNKAAGPGAGPVRQEAGGAEGREE